MVPIAVAVAKHNQRVGIVGSGFWFSILVSGRPARRRGNVFRGEIARLIIDHVAVQIKGRRQEITDQISLALGDATENARQLFQPRFEASRELCVVLVAYRFGYPLDVGLKSLGQLAEIGF